MNLIDNTKELQNACKVLKKQKIIAIDCEFIREKTYYPIPCLIQVGYEEGAYLIDPLAKEMDYESFFAVLQNKKILKVFHSGRQDIEILYNLSGFVPTPVFDTQIAAQACGLGEAVSYENLVRVYCGIELDKSCRLTNWQLRPLSDEQLEYAAGDVNGKSMLAHTAYREGEVALANMLGGHERVNYLSIPSVIYTNPEVACVGETSESIKAKGLDAICTSVTLKYSGRYIAENEGGDGIVKLVVDKNHKTLLGVHMIGNYASEIIYGAAMMVEKEMRVDDVKKLVFPHPTVCEVIREAMFMI